MNADSIRKLFQEVKQGKLSADDAVNRLRHLPFEDLGFAKVDHHRALRNGMPEIILGEGKTPGQVAGIFSRLAKHGGNVLATRATPQQFQAVKKKVRAVEYRELARAIVLQKDPTKYGKGIIAVVSAGTSDIPVAEEAVVTAELMGSEVRHVYDVGVAGIHRLAAGEGAEAERCCCRVAVNDANILGPRAELPRDELGQHGFDALPLRGRAGRDEDASRRLDANGRAPAGTSGGALAIGASASVTLRRCTFADNEAPVDGGAIAHDGSSLTISPPSTRPAS